MPSEPIEELHVYGTERVSGRVLGHREVEYVKEGGPLPGPGRARILPDLIEVRGLGAYHPSVVAREDGTPDWPAYYRAVDGKEPMIYVWRPAEED